MTTEPPAPSTADDPAARATGSPAAPIPDTRAAPAADHPAAPRADDPAVPAAGSPAVPAGAARHPHGAGRHGPAEGAAHPPRPVPAWRRATRGEPRWASTAAVLAVVVVQFALPGHLAVRPRPLLPVVELALLVALVAANPHRIERASRAYRATGMALIAVICAANAYSAVRLVAGLVRGSEHLTASALLLTGGAIWLTNVVIFALLYWELDRGGPAARAQGERDVPDFLFVQMQSPDLAPPHWEPVFLDYFYLSFTNSTAFSPTDVMPVTRWAKALMLAQSAVSLVTMVLVVARAVNILQ